MKVVLQSKSQPHRGEMRICSTTEAQQKDWPRVMRLCGYVNQILPLYLKFSHPVIHYSLRCFGNLLCDYFITPLFRTPQNTKIFIIMLCYQMRCVTWSWSLPFYIRTTSDVHAAPQIFSSTFICFHPLSSTKGHRGVCFGLPWSALCYIQITMEIPWNGLNAQTYQCTIR